MMNMCKRNIWMSIIVFLAGIGLMLLFDILFYDGNIFIMLPIFPLLAIFIIRWFQVEKTITNYVLFIVIFSYFLMIYILGRYIYFYKGDLRLNFEFFGQFYVLPLVFVSIITIGIYYMSRKFTSDKSTELLKTGIVIYGMLLSLIYFFVLIFTSMAGSSWV